MNRRRFVSKIAAGTAGLAAVMRSSPFAQGSAGLTVRFVGMMGFVQRPDASILVATPGHHALGAYAHTPFLMARAGSRVADALGLTPHPGVIPAAFDQSLEQARPDEFVFRCLDNTDITVESADGARGVDLQADHMAQMHRIAPGKRVRNDLQRWSHSTVSLRGGRIVDSAAHPDAGRIWTFGAHRQPLTDAVNYSADGGTIRLSMGPDARTITTSAGEAAHLWVVAAAAPGTSLHGGAPATFPPHIELCYNALFTPGNG